MTTLYPTSTGVPTASVVAPRLRITINGADQAGAIHADIDQTGHYGADTFEAEIALGKSGDYSLAWWADQQNIDVQISVAASNAGASESWVQLFDGIVDTVDFDIAPQVVRISGRDRSSLLIDAPTQEAFPNKTSSEIATLLAERHGLTPNVATTTILVGQYYQLEHSTVTLGAFSHQTTEWNLLIYLAQKEGFDLWVSGNTLNFQPAQSSSGSPIVVSYKAPFVASPYPVMSVENLQLSRNLRLASDIEVTVKSWDSRANRAYERVVRLPGVHSTATSTVVNYVEVKPGLSPAEALKYGQTMLAQLSRHERVIHTEMPADTTTTPRQMVQLSSTGSAFDQPYYIDSIRRSLDCNGGFTQTIRAKNSSPRTQQTVI
ncbi:phage late control D family protein [Acidocella aminolytica]|uniref:Phage protein D n=1 Tax=Acidocella aminolytica 101 = DSM 11237 TaxID=1120923 RepID=A0A0D6PFY5_9PROT|nr:hypothetical protein [Acidocella aminolytica]GAN79769.1 hypothetical protein Aam_030_002 [Acidocella aminolytica 101 = DSM 11237]GBQ31994.1 hypothetical protein AA11237_0037 [Acidocella aminolytica 101 = DSM 11237]SHF35930.1 Phage protein D [Acidocella aminolytica 101 = DSM 11237]